jgi:O-antigen ligase
MSEPADCQGRGRERVLDPVVLAAGLGLIFAVAVAVEITPLPRDRAQQLTALGLGLIFAVAVGLAPRNGLMLLFLVPAIFNGEDLQPYFFLLEALVWLTLIGGFAAHLWRRRSLAFPYAPFILLFLLSTVVSFPLNVKELWLEIQVSSWRELVEDLLRGDLWGNLFYVRTVLNVLSGVGLYVLVVNQPWSRELLVRLAVGVTLVVSAVELVGFGWVRFFPPRLFLGLYLDGNVAGGFSGVGFNTSYFAQWALAYLPFAVLVLVERAPRWARAWAVATVLLGGYTVLLTYQRGAYVVLIVEVGLLLLAARGLGVPRGRGAVVAVSGVGVALLMLLAGFLMMPVGARALEKMLMLWRSGDSYREHVLQVAWRMFRAEPVLGIGSGRFAHMFQFYSSDPAAFQWGSLSSHNLYTQLLAEQGVLGLGSFLAVLGVTVGRIVHAQRRLGEVRPVVLFLLVSLAAWLGYGLLQYTFLLRSMQVYFWLTLGLLVALTLPLPPPRPGRGWVVGVLVVVGVAGGFRAHAAAMRPVPRGFAFGLHEREADGTRWTRGGAVLEVPVAGRVLRFDVAYPIPETSRRPQRVTVLVDGSPVRRITLTDPAWKTVEIPIEKPLGSRVLLGVRVGYTFIPAAIGVSPDTRRLGVLVRSLRWVP